jgi:hypothetical protein
VYSQIAYSNLHWFKSQNGTVNFELKIIFKEGARNGFLRLADMLYVTNSLFTVHQYSFGENENPIL